MEPAADDGAAHVLRDLQDEMLPRSLPVLDDVDLASGYVVSDRVEHAGGDWFDAVQIGHRVVLVAGDVVGHGVTAVAVMGQLRAVLQERLRHGVPLVEAVDALDRFARGRLESRASTVCVAALDRRDGRLEYVTAGHPPPIVVSPRGEARHLPRTGAGPLGLGGAARAGWARLAPDDVLVIYSDGLVERPGRRPSEGIAELESAARRSALRHDGAALAGVAHDLLGGLTHTTGYDDDVAMVLARRCAARAPLRVSRPCGVDALAATLREVTAWLGALEVSVGDVAIVQHLVGELVTNAVEHAYAGLGPDPRATVEVDLAVDGESRVHGTVTDHGRWQPAGAGAGRGLAIADAVSDELVVRTGDVGTSVHFALPVGRDAPVLVGEDTVPRTPQPLFDVVRSPGRLQVLGPVDISTVDRFRVLTAAAPMTPLPVLDLTEVSFLGSAGVQVLFALRERHPDLSVCAERGSVADQVLDLVGFGHDHR